MRAAMIKAGVIGVMLTACDQSPSGPGSHGVRWPAPAFSIQPGAAVAESTSCDPSVAYAFNSGPLGGHLDLASTATFYPPNSSTARTQCGDLVFTEDPATPGRVVMYERLKVDTTNYQAW